MGDVAEIRRASPEEAGDLSRVAFAAKGHWGYPARWMEGWRRDLTVSPGFVRENDVFVAAVAGRASGFYALVTRGREVWLEHLWVPPDAIGTGLGGALFEHAVGRAAELGAGAVRIESDPNAEGFYRRMGARRVGEKVLEIEGQRRALPVMVVESSPGARGIPYPG